MEMPWSNHQVERAYDRFSPVAFDSFDGFGEGPGAVRRSTGIFPDLRQALPGMAYLNMSTWEQDYPMPGTTDNKTIDMSLRDRTMSLPKTLHIFV